MNNVMVLPGRARATSAAPRLDELPEIFFHVSGAEGRPVGDGAVVVMWAGVNGYKQESVNEVNFSQYNPVEFVESIN